MAFTECVTAINDMSRHGGFAPVQWVLARFPRKPATLGYEEERLTLAHFKVVKMDQQHSQFKASIDKKHEKHV